MLDVGCGDGKISAYLAKRLPMCNVVGSDVSDEMVQFASKRYPSSEYPNLSFNVKDARRLGFHNEFDRALSFNCLHWMKNQKRAFQEIYSGLKPNGKAVIVVAPKSPLNDFKKISLKVIVSFRWFFSFFNFKSVHSFHTEEEYRQLLQDIHFTIEEMNMENREAIFQSREELDTFLKAILTPLYHLPEAKRPLFLDDFYRQMIKQGKVDEQGAARIHFNELKMILSK